VWSASRGITKSKAATSLRRRARSTSLRRRTSYISFTASSKATSKKANVQGNSLPYPHTLDEQSGLGLFFTGNDPTNLKSAYGNSDFDRTYVFSVSYLYQFPDLSAASGWMKQVVNGWVLNGVTTLQSGQPLWAGTEAPERTRKQRGSWARTWARLKNDFDAELQWSGSAEMEKR
jgi:hypothetical protein